LNAQEALQELSKGNKRFLQAQQGHQQVTDKIRMSLATDGQSPMAAIIGCADSRVPVEIVFDAQPGDLFVLRNAGNTCMCAEGSMVGSIEYCIGHLRTSLVLVLGHTKCGALAGATQIACAPEPISNAEGSDTASSSSSGSSKKTMLQSLLTSLEPPVMEAAKRLPPTASLDEVAALAIECNVFHTMKSLLKYSDMLKDGVKDGSVQIHGAIYDITTGKVQFLGALPPTMVAI
jgi:carbonic anhydrase